MTDTPPLHLARNDGSDGFIIGSHLTLGIPVPVPGTGVAVG